MAQKKKKNLAALSLSAKNYWLFGLAVLLLIVGYIFLSLGPVDGVMTLTIAPIILVIAYCIVVPIAIFAKPKPEQNSKE